MGIHYLEGGGVGAPPAEIQGVLVTSKVNLAFNLK